MLELVLLFAACVLLGLGCFAAAGWVFFTPEEVGVEQIFLLLVCLLLGLTFFGFAAWMGLYTQLRELWKTRPAQASSASAEALAPNVSKEEEATREEAGKSAS